MHQEDRQLERRFSELARRAASRRAWVWSEFLTIAEQDVLRAMPPGPDQAPFVLEGGYEAAERRVALFGSEALCGPLEESPLVCLRLSPAAPKFSDPLTHRDFLGALMSLGIRRSLLGDILVHENSGYLFCLSSIADYIAEQLIQIKHTTVRCARVNGPPPTVSAAGEVQEFVVASPRLDAIVSAVYNLSRSESQRLFPQEKVAVNSRLVGSAAQVPAPGDLISVRGYGRLRYQGIARETKKGRLRISAIVY